MEILLLKNMLWPAITTLGVIALLNYILDRKKSSRNLGIIFFILGAGVGIYINYVDKSYMFLQIYLFLFLFSISLVILALKKRIDAFTMVGILLMITMLIFLLRFPLI